MVTIFITIVSLLLSSAIGYVPYKIANIKTPKKVIDFGKKWMSIAFLLVTMTLLTPFFSGLLIYGKPDFNKLIILPFLLLIFGAIGFFLGNLFGYFKLKKGKKLVNAVTSWFKNNQNRKINSKSTEHDPDAKWFLAATLEIDEKRHDTELWSKIVTQSRGDQNEARFIYIEQRACEMQLENDQAYKQKFSELDIKTNYGWVFCIDCHNNFQPKFFHVKCPKCGASRAKFSTNPKEIVALIEKYDNNFND